MTSPLEYHVLVRRSVPASVALIGLLVLPVVLVSSSHAQINGVPSSVTSPGFGGRPVNGTRASVTSLGPNGYSSNQRVTFSTGFVGPGVGHHRHHHHYVEYAPPVVYALPVPYAVDIGDSEDDADSASNYDDSDSNYRGGPTVFDRRGSGASSYIPPVRDSASPRAQRVDDPPAAAPDDTPQDPTLLVFKDGHVIQVGNYAIIGPTLFDLTPGHARKVALADLDLDATRKQNDDRGVTFQLPATLQAN